MLAHQHLRQSGEDNVKYGHDPPPHHHLRELWPLRHDPREPHLPIGNLPLNLPLHTVRQMSCLQPPHQHMLCPLSPLRAWGLRPPPISKPMQNRQRQSKVPSPPIKHANCSLHPCHYVNHPACPSRVEARIWTSRGGSEEVMTFYL